MATKKVIDMTARGSSALAFNDFVYLTKEVPLTDEKMQASVMRDYVLSGIKTSANSGLAQTSTAYAFANPDYELSLDVTNLTASGGTASVTDYIAIDQGAGIKKLLVGDLPFASSASSVASLIGGTNVNVSAATGNVTVNVDTTMTGLTSVTSTDFVGDLTGDVTGDVTGDLTGDVTGDVTGDLTGTASIATALAATLGVTAGGTGLTTVAKGSVLAVNAADTISAVAGVTNGHVLTYDSAADTVGWAAPGHATGTVTNVASGSGLTGGPITGSGTLSVELTANGGLEPNVAGVNGTLQVAQGISQYDVAQFATGVVDNDFLKIDGTAVEGRSASEVKTDLSLDNVENTALSTWTGSTNVTTLGTIATGTWEGTTVAVDQGGTGQTSYTNGQLLIGNTTGNTLAKATLTAGTNITITEGAGSITIAAAAGGDPAGTAVAMAIALGG